MDWIQCGWLLLVLSIFILMIRYQSQVSQRLMMTISSWISILCRLLDIVIRACKGALTHRRNQRNERVPMRCRIFLQQLLHKLSRIPMSHMLCVIIGYGVGTLTPYLRLKGGEQHLPDSFINVMKPSLPIIDQQEALGDILQSEGKTSGMEVGVKQGNFSEAILSRWTNCMEYVLLDPWVHQKHYDDHSNVDQSRHNEFMDATKQRMKPFEARGTNVIFVRETSHVGHQMIRDNSLDYIYIDARHDYQAMTEDLEWFWPKLKEGGIFAGHDFCNANEEPSWDQDWCTFADGSKCENNKAVKAAVEEFAAKHGDLQRAIVQKSRSP